MFSEDPHDPHNEADVIKVANLVAKFEEEIRRQNPNNRDRFIRSVRQVLRESRRVTVLNHPLQQCDDEEDLFLPTSNKTQELELTHASLDSCNYKKTINQQNRLTQLRDKCSEIITKNVRKSKGSPAPPLLPRPMRGTDPPTRCRSMPASTYKSRHRKKKVIELQEVQPPEEFTIIDYEDCVPACGSESDDDDDRLRSDKTLRTRLRESAESLDSGCDIGTPRASTTTSADHQCRHFEADTPTSVSRITQLAAGIRSDEISPYQKPEQTKRRCLSLGLQQDERRCMSLGLQDDDERNNSSDSELDESLDKVFHSRTAFSLFHPPESTEQADRYAEKLRLKLTRKISGLSDHDRDIANLQADHHLQERTLISPPTDGRDSELQEFIYRCFSSTVRLQSRIQTKSEEELVACFILPPRISVPDLDYDFLSVMLESSCCSSTESDGEIPDCCT